MEVYIDLYFLVNASMDLLCLLITARLMHRQVKTRRLLLSATLGGLYASAALLLGFGGFAGLLLDLLAALLLVAVAFSTYRMRVLRLFWMTAVYVLTSMTMGGIMTALYTLLNRLELPFEVLQGDAPSAFVLGLLAIVSGIAASRSGRLMGLSQKTKSVTVEATLLGQRVTLHAMVDTGNLLRDPISGRGVIVADRRALAGALPKAFLQGGREGERAVFSWLRSTPKCAGSVRLIPAKTASGEGILAAILPDRLIVIDQNDCFDGDYLVAISDLGDAACGFDAVIPSS